MAKEFLKTLIFVRGCATVLLLVSLAVALPEFEFDKSALKSRRHSESDLDKMVESLRYRSRRNLDHPVIELSGNDVGILENIGALAQIPEVVQKLNKPGSGKEDLRTLIIDDESKDHSNHSDHANQPNNSTTDRVLEAVAGDKKNQSKSNDEENDSEPNSSTLRTVLIVAGCIITIIFGVIIVKNVCCVKKSSLDGSPPRATATVSLFADSYRSRVP